MAYRVCQHPDCNAYLKGSKTKKYCTEAHRNSAKQRRHYAKKKLALTPLKEVLDADGRLHAERTRRGEVYDQLRSRRDWVEAYRLGALTDGDLQSLTGGDSGAVSQALAALAVDEYTARQAKDWQGPPPEAVAALDNFQDFRDRYFRTETGDPYVTTPFHARWIEAIVRTQETGGRLMILSPPRHGKTALLLHFCVWQIVKNPHIRIVWVAGNKDLAMDWTASLEEELETNLAIQQDFLAPGQSFRPGARSRRSWARQQFTVDTRTHAVKSPTFVASSRGSKILSRDVDILIADDIEDHGSTLIASNREATRNWWTTDVGSRKEPHSAHVVIGSRQHPDDLYGHLLESDAWESIIESAHSEECDITELEPDLHTNCMLWQERLDYRWLMDQLGAATTTGGRGMWEMVYLNRPAAEGLMVFNRDAVLAARDHTRGLFSYPKDSILVAGLDPSGTGYQASFLWAYEPQSRKLFMVDTENEQGGGIPRAREQVALWFDQSPHRKLYCRKWFVEENMFKGGIVKDEVLAQYCRNNMIVLEPHQTGTNKWDKNMGVSAINSWFEAGLISLPYADTAAQRKTDAYIRQLLGFETLGPRGGRKRRATSDLVMASWFPFPHIQYLDHARVAGMEVQYASTTKNWTARTMFNYDRRTP